MQFCSRIVSLFAAFFLISLLSYGATVTGTVTGPDSAPFKGAFVEAENLKTHITVIVLSNKDGHYHIENLPAGEYDLLIKATGYRSDPRTGVSLTTQQNASADFSLHKAAVLWSDLSLYQGKVLLPDLPARRFFIWDGSGPIRDAPCQICHAFQTRMAPWVRDQAAWRARVDFMRSAMHYSLSRVTDPQADEIASYLTSLFGPNSILPQSPADDPAYKDTVHTFSDNAMNIVYVEYQLPGSDRMPWSAVPDGKGNVWMPYYGDRNKIARLNIETGQVQEYSVPNKGTAGVHSVYPAADGSVWLAEFAGDKLGRWDPKTQEITEYPDANFPADNGAQRHGSKHTVRVSENGGVICASGNPVSRFDLKTGKFTDYSDGSYGVTLDNEGNCWFTEYSALGKIGRIDAKTMQMQTWTPPSAKSHLVFSRRLQVDSDGIVWFSESEGNQIGRFDPKTQTFREYPLPGPMASPYPMNLDKDHQVWYGSEYMDVIGRLDPATGDVVEYPFPHSENTMREFFLDSQGRMWYATPANNRVGYFYLAGQTEQARN